MLHSFLVPVQMVFTQERPELPEADGIDTDAGVE